MKPAFYENSYEKVGNGLLTQGLAILLLVLMSILWTSSIARSEAVTHCNVTDNGGQTFVGTQAPCDGKLVLTQDDFDDAKNNSYEVSHNSQTYTADQWYTGNITNMSKYFYYNTTFNVDISGWDTSNVTNMSEMFRLASAFNQDIGGWNTSSVRNFYAMFDNATAFNQDLPWNTSAATDMSYMFYYAENFNGDISGWDVSSVTTMNSMFSYATIFNGDIGGWTTSSLEGDGLTRTFESARAFNQDISGWDISGVTELVATFAYTAVFNQNLNSWDTSSVQSMANTFSYAEAFNGDISGWDTSNVSNFSSAFSWASDFDQDIGGWNTGSATNMDSMFRQATSFNQDISFWNVLNIPSKPSNFDTSTDANWTDVLKPQWGTAGNPSPLKLIGTTPEDDAVNAELNTNLVMEFDANVQAGSSGTIGLYLASNDLVVEQVNVTDSRVQFSGSTVQVSLQSALSSNTSYYVNISADAIVDASGNAPNYGGIDDKTTWNFTVADYTAPQVSNLSPADDSTNVAVDVALEITFDEAVQAGTGNISVLQSSDNGVVKEIDVASSDVVFSGDTVEISLGQNLADDTAYYIRVADTAITDASENANPFSGITDETTWSFTTGDYTSPQVSDLSPGDDATNVAVDAALQITFDEAVQAGTGNISVFQSSNDNSVAVLDVTGGSVDFSDKVVTVTLSTNLDEDTGYYVRIDNGAITDASVNANSFAGITDSTTWSFETVDNTAPQVSSLSPADDAMNVAVDSTLQITFDEAVQAGTGNISVLQSSDNNPVKEINVTSSDVVFFGDTVEISLGQNLDDDTDYYVLIANGAITDASGNLNAFAGIAETTCNNMELHNRGLYISSNFIFVAR